jgi:hypothetical protein
VCQWNRDAMGPQLGPGAVKPCGRDPSLGKIVAHEKTL